MKPKEQERTKVSVSRNRLDHRSNLYKPTHPTTDRKGTNLDIPIYILKTEKRNPQQYIWRSEPKKIFPA